MTNIQILLNTIFWGFILWLFGYVLGIVFFCLCAKGADRLLHFAFGCGVDIVGAFQKDQKRSVYVLYRPWRYLDDYGRCFGLFFYC